MQTEPPEMRLGRAQAVREIIDAFIESHRLPPGFADMAEAHYLPLAHYLAGQQRTAARPIVVGINGAQGTGKTTLADLLALVLPAIASLRVAVVSLDDFYLTHADREALAAELHPLLAVRGVAGTHDVAWLAGSLDALRALAPGETLRLPRFDKATDDRAPEAEWQDVTGPVDIILFEGWLVGSRAVPEADLSHPLNALERERDADGRWRRYVNERLATDYAALFSRIDRLVFLAAPGFDAVLRWRLLQEEKLAERNAGAAIMDASGVAAFLQYFERITRQNLARLRGAADAVLTLDQQHRCTAHEFREARATTTPAG